MDEELSPFDDRYRANERSDTSERGSIRGNASALNDVINSYRDSRATEEAHVVYTEPQTDTGNLLDDITEMDQTQEDIVLDTTNMAPAQAARSALPGQGRDETTRLRWGTKRIKQRSGSRRIDINRSKTLRWAKKNIANPFEEMIDNKTPTPEDEEIARNRSKDLRTIFYNLPLPDEMLDDEGHPTTVYPRNKIRTTKYTPLNFIPKNLLVQFHNFANVYFLVLIILGAFQIFGVTNPGFSAVPLIVIVVITALKDALEDSRRTILDLEVNNTQTYILQGVPNTNVDDDNVSTWRKFKKFNTRMILAMFRSINEHTTKKGKRNRLLRKREEMKHKNLSGDKNPRNSMNTLGSYRMSADYARYSMDVNDKENIGKIFEEGDDANIINTNLPVDSEVRFSKNFWKSVKVGDIIRIHNNDEIPADVILLSTSENDGACYVETKNLDGETNLKVRQSLKATNRLRSSKDIAKGQFWVESEGPHANLYSYQGNVRWHDTVEGSLKNEPVNINNMLLRGCTLRNTKWAMGIVVFTGNDTKIMLNAGVTPTKKSRISRELNFSVLLNFGLLFVLCFVAAVINGVYYARHPESRDYFEFGKPAKGSSSLNGFVSFWVALILYQSLVPISLYISVEIIKTAQAAFIYGDVMLYNAKLDYPCTPKTWNISDDLGQIEYIFSDKTGTLTQNVMEFKKCTINGVPYGRAYTEALAGLRKRQGIDVEAEGRKEKAEIAEDRIIMIEDLKKISFNSQFRPDEITFVSKEFTNDLIGGSGDYQKKTCEHFMLALSLCHSVLTERSKEDPEVIEIKAQSPDEESLVKTARDMGFNFIGNTKKGMIVEVQGVQKEFQVLNILEFNSSRKRMSCIIKVPGERPGDEPKALLLCKGADSVIYSRLSTKPGANDEKLLEKTALHLEQYATEGLRTLCLAQKEMTWGEYLKWNELHSVAAASIINREEELDKVTDLVERDLILLGGTAIEDRLQDGVPDSIALLGEAGIKLWVLTGDKVETAINIGFSCNLLNNDMELLVVKSSGDDVAKYGNSGLEIVDNLLTEYLQDRFNMTGSEQELEEAKKIHDVPKANLAVIIDGDALKLALTGEEIRRKFLLLCKNCKAVLCCRVSPSQKAAVVKLVKNTLDVMTLAIGDGSNDVAMIQSADVGVGIAGEEGRQAVMSSDYAIAQFRYLTRLVLVHGKWCYKRLGEMIPQFFYKNVIFTLALFWFGIYNNYDGSYLFEYTYLTFYNLAFTSIPVIVLGILDQDVNDTISVVVPELYRAGILRTEWNQRKFIYYMCDGLYQSAISFFFPFLLFHKGHYITKNGLSLDHRWFVGIPVTAIAVISCNFYVLMNTKRWDWFTCLFITISCMIFFGWTGIWSSSKKSNEFYWSAQRMYNTPTFWAVLFVGVVFCLLPRFSFNIFRQIKYPNDVDIIREMWNRGVFSAFPEGYDPTDPEQKKLPRPSIVSGAMGAPEAEPETSAITLVSEEIELQNSSNAYESSKESNISSISEDSTKQRELRHENMKQTVGRNGKRMMNRITELVGASSSVSKSSLDRTREEMLNNSQLDTRFSVERARASLDLPGITHAQDLVKRR